MWLPWIAGPCPARRILVTMLRCRRAVMHRMMVIQTIGERTNACSPPSRKTGVTAPGRVGKRHVSGHAGNECGQRTKQHRVRVSQIAVNTPYENEQHQDRRNHGKADPEQPLLQQLMFPAHAPSFKPGSKQRISAPLVRSEGQHVLTAEGVWGSMATLREGPSNAYPHRPERRCHTPGAASRRPCKTPSAAAVVLPGLVATGEKRGCPGARGSHGCLR